MASRPKPSPAPALLPPDEDGAALPTVHVLRALVHAMRERGVSAARFLGEVGLTETALQDESLRVSLEDEERLFQAAVRLSGDPAFGLRWAERSDVGSWGAASLVIAYVPTLREAIQVMERYAPVFSGGISVSSHERDGLVAARFSLSPAKAAIARRIYTELFTAGVARMCRGELADHLRAAEFAYPAPVYASEYEAIFGGLALFDRPHTELVFEPALLECRRAGGSSDVILKAAQQVADGDLELQTGRASFGRRIREHLAAARLGSVDMQSAARALGLSARSLRRRLEAEGLAWTTLLNEARAVEAKRLLAKLTIQQAAYELGFADASAFHRAFKKWTGLTPAEFQRSRRGP